MPAAIPYPPVPEAPAAPPAAPPAPANAPPAAKIVSEADVLAVRSELEAEKNSHAETAAQKKVREVRISELEDELFRLKQAQQAAPKPPKAKKSPGLREWLTGDGWDE